MKVEHLTVYGGPESIKYCEYQVGMLFTEIAEGTYDVVEFVHPSLGILRKAYVRRGAPTEQFLQFVFPDLVEPQTDLIEALRRESGLKVKYRGKLNKATSEICDLKAETKAMELELGELRGTESQVKVIHASWHRSEQRCMKLVPENTKLRDGNSSRNIDVQRTTIETQGKRLDEYRSLCEEQQLQLDELQSKLQDSIEDRDRYLKSVDVFRCKSTKFEIEKYTLQRTLTAERKDQAMEVRLRRQLQDECAELRDKLHSPDYKSGQIEKLKDTANRAESLTKHRTMELRKTEIQLERADFVKNSYSQDCDLLKRRLEEAGKPIGWWDGRKWKRRYKELKNQVKRLQSERSQHIIDFERRTENWMTELTERNRYEKLFRERRKECKRLKKLDKKLRYALKVNAAHEENVDDRSKAYGDLKDLFDRDGRALLYWKQEYKLLKMDHNTMKEDAEKRLSWFAKALNNAHAQPNFFYRWMTRDKPFLIPKRRRWSRLFLQFGTYSMIGYAIWRMFQ